ncbi:Transposon Tf2-11 polyprotein [Labeo rohita]|uniref:ribonuclease H n=1 Tax=Labeo rohita TaxID=84645 RepID=A0ABQ8L2L0_LABRO|nr:Transposon Tf2-11 polyprotein [Labeo rohita]
MNNLPVISPKYFQQPQVNSPHRICSSGYNKETPPSTSTPSIFRTLAAASGWNETALLGAYRQGLNPQIRTAMALYDDSIGLEAFLQRTTRVSQRLAACQPTIADLGGCLHPSTRTHASGFISPHTNQKKSANHERIMFVLWTFRSPTAHLSHTTPTPRDSGSSGNFISQACLEKLQLQRCQHKHTLAVKTIQGKPLGRGKIKYSSPVITLQVGLFHTEELRFLVLEGSTVSVILGRPWLQLHHLELSWDPCDIIRWSEHCHTNCLVNLPTSVVAPVFLSWTQIESPAPVSTPKIPAEYMAFQDVFSKQAATLLPPHRPWDCAIDLLPGSQLPKGRVYPLSIPECQAMEEYIKEALQQGFIQPSTSPAASSFFFVGKKDGGLRPCIDYRQLNSQIIQQPYPLPLVPAALEELRGTQVFTKLDLWSAYNLVRVGDEWKTAFVTPTGHYEYRVMPYGLSISPSVFQTFMNEVFREFLHRFVIVYIDDIFIYSRNMAEHRQQVQQVLHKLCEQRLYLKLEKCEFHHPSVQFLGYVISAEGVQMDQGKVTAILDWTLPTTIKELQRFLGFTNFYHHFIQNYSLTSTSRPSGYRSPVSGLWTPRQSTNPLTPPIPLLVAQYAPGYHQRPRSHLGVDFVTDLPAAEGNTCILVAVDRFSKMCKFIPLKGLPTAMETAELLFQHLFRHFGLPEEIVSDRGPQFISHVWKAFFKFLGVSVNLSSGYHPQTNGQTERKIQELGRYLRSYCYGDQHSWNRFLLWAEYHRHDTFPVRTQLPSNRCSPGRRNPPTFQLWTTGFGRARECGTQLTTICSGLCDNTSTSPTSEEDLLPISNQLARDLRLCLPCRKLSPRYIGPFTILRRINDVTVQLQIPPRYRRHPTFHVSLIKPFHPSATEHPGAEAEPPPPEVLDTPSIYTVHVILDSRRQGGHLEYLVDWEGYGPEEQSWVALCVVFWCREPPVEGVGGGEGVVSGIHHSHHHLTHLLKRHPLVQHHLNSDCLHLHLFAKPLWNFSVLPELVAWLILGL